MSRLRLPFVKMQGVGNDFVVLEASSWPTEADWHAQAIRLCDRKFGIGADGLLIVGPSDVAEIRMQMFNPDGTEDMCGNGLRCVVRLAHARGWISGPTNAIEHHSTVETLAGIRRVHVETQSAGAISVEMGTPLFRPAELPMLLPDRDAVIDYPLPVEGFGDIPVTVVNTGTTHTVVWVDELPGDEWFFAISPRIENHPLFPERTSVLWSRLTGEDTAEVRIWERGAGETLGCGTGACAVTVAAAVQKKIRPLQWPVDPGTETHLLHVTSRGGRLTAGYSVHPSGEDPLLLSGPAEVVFTGDISPE